MTDNRPHVLVIGGTRFIGKATVARLLELGCEVTLFNRGRTDPDAFPGIRRITGNRKYLSQYRDDIALLKPDVVVDMMLVTEQDAIDLIATVSGVVKHVVAISSCDVYRGYGRLIGTEPGPPETMPLTEESPLRERLYPYRGASERLQDYDKIPIEKKIMTASKLSATVLRLPMVYGPGDYQHRLFPYLKRIDDGRDKILLDHTLADWRDCRSYVDDVAFAITLAVTDPKASGRIYNVAEADNLAEAEWVRRICNGASWGGEVIVLPRDFRPTREEDGFDPSHHLMVDSSRIRDELGYGEQIPQAEALARTMAWERENPPDTFDPDSFDYTAEDKILSEISDQIP